MQKSQKGFTLIELVVVIVLLGILGVTALAKFQDLSAQAADAAEQGIASELSSAAAINFAAGTLGTVGSTTILFADCEGAAGAPSTTLNALMASGAAPTDNLTYAFAAGGSSAAAAEDAACGSGLTFNCSITNSQGTGGSTGIASILCIP